MEYVPPVQALHASDVFAPVNDEYDDAGHGEHVAELPARSAVEYLPALQSEHSVLPVRAYLPDGHVIQTLEEFAPFTVAYFPASQFLHWLEPVISARLEYVPAIQSRHTSELVAPSLDEYFPASQEVQSVDSYAIPVEYVPA